jgi:hypothetical protein
MIQLNWLAIASPRSADVTVTVRFCGHRHIRPNPTVI